MSHYSGRTAPPAYQSPSPGQFNPVAHPDSTFSRLRANRQQQNRDPPQMNQEELEYDQLSPVSSLSTSPVPPPHRESHGRNWPQESGYRNSYSVTTPGADNFGDQAGGGIAGIALNVASANARESGLEAMRNIHGPNDQRGVELQNYQETMPYGRSIPREGSSYSSTIPLGAAAAPIVYPSPAHSFSNAHYSDSPYNRHSTNFGNEYEIDPESIQDDEDMGLEYPSNRGSNKGSMMSLGHYSNAERTAGMDTAVAGGAAGVTSHLRGGPKSPEYAPVPNGASDGNPAYAGGHTMADLGWAAEKKVWLREEQRQNKKRMWIIVVVMILIIIGALVGGITGGLLSNRKGSSSSNSNSAANDEAQNGDLSKNSAEIQALMNNKALHKVFPGIDYTPINTQYPDCLTSPPSQNNVTRDLAVLSQLTNVVRLYGTDCNQTEMLLHSIDALDLNGTVKVWMGVWISTNDTTNTRQLDQMYTILDTYGSSPFEGIIIGNEILFRGDLTATELGTLITNVRANLTAKSIDLPLATSDLGDAWSKAPALAADVDYIMSNIHPFFAGVQADVAADWTINFWNEFDIPLAAEVTNKPKNIISETGWPSTGGMDCGGATNCTNGSVAGIDEMNTFMDGFVCQALANGTNYFWFEAFDEPWKIIFDTPGENWEDKWGLMDVNRNLKSGVVIPECGGTTVDS